MVIMEKKKDFMVCGGRFCTNGYLITSGCDSCMLQEFQVCLCLGTDAACLPVPDSIPKSCACLPCCFIYPKVACCPVAGELFPEMENLHEKKKDAKMCGGTCLGPLYAGNTYFITPYTLCADELSTCLCFAQDCAFPCTDSIPMTCNILPCCFVYPKVACCPKLGDLMEGSGKEFGAPEDVVTDAELDDGLDTVEIEAIERK